MYRIETARLTGSWSVIATEESIALILVLKYTDYTIKKRVDENAMGLMSSGGDGVKKEAAAKKVWKNSRDRKLSRYLQYDEFFVSSVLKVTIFR